MEEVTREVPEERKNELVNLATDSTLSSLRTMLEMQKKNHSSETRTGDRSLSTSPRCTGAGNVISIDSSLMDGDTSSVESKF